MELDLENNLTIIGTKGLYVALFVYIFFYFFKKWGNQNMNNSELVSIVLLLFSYISDLDIDYLLYIPIESGERQNALNKINLYYNDFQKQEKEQEQEKNDNKESNTKKPLLDNKASTTFKNYYINNKVKRTGESAVYLDRIDFNYKNKKIFDNLSVNFPKNKIISIIGDNGIGKSTLLKLIFGIYKPNNGKIYVDNETDFADIREQRKNINYVQQNPVLFDRTVKDNLFYTFEDNKNNQEIIKQLGLEEMLKNITNTEGNLGIRGDRLSGGQRQILSMLRIILKKPKKIVLLDEPTSALDHTIADILYNMIKYMKNQGTTIISVTHDKELIKMSDTVINMNYYISR